MTEDKMSKIVPNDNTNLTVPIEINESFSPRGA